MDTHKRQKVFLLIKHILRKISLLILVTSFGSFSQTSSQTITVTSPNGGESWQANSTQFIKWESKNIDKVKIEYSLDNGLSWGTIAESVDASLGQYTWTAADVKTPYVLIRISDVYNPSVYDVSDQDFTLNISEKNKGINKSAQLSGTPIKIMPLGDSITWGTNPDDSTSPGYRDSLYIKLIATEYNIDFVGSLSGYGSDPNNEGHPGWFAGPPSPDLYGGHNIADSIYYFLNSHIPDIILLHIGTNDIGETGASWVKTASEVADAVNSILDSIYNFSSDPNHNIVIFLAQIIDDADNRGISDTYSTQIHQKTLDFNSYLMNTILPGRPSGQKIVLVDMYSALGQNYHTPGNPYFDTQYSVHPNTLGYNKMAETWFTAMQNYFLPVLASPDNGGTGQPINVGLTWNAPEAASDMLSHSESFNYELQVATNPDFSLAHIVFSSSSIPSGTTSSSPSGLQYGTQYFWRVRIANYGWSNIWNFTTEPGIPSIDSIYVTSVLANSAVLNAKVNTKNQSTAVKFQWDTNNDAVWPNDQPASNSPLTSDGVGTLSISSLTPNTTYYFRSYVSNGSGTDTSIIKSFTTLPGAHSIDSAYATSITTNSASLNSKVNTGNQSTIVRFQWDTNNDTVWPNDQPASNSPLTSDGVGTLSISGLAPNTTYYFRSYVSNGSGTDTSIIKSFTTLPGAPTIDSAYATSITTNSASLNSKVNTGNQSTIVRFQWDTNNDTVWPNDQPASNSPLTSDGVGTLSISSLTPNTTYYFRSYVSNGSGTDTSIIKSFTTLPGAHSIDSAYATSITTNSASLNSKVNTGNQSTIVRFQWDTNNDTVWPNDQPASNSPLTSDGVGTLSISGLAPNTIYYFRSYVSNGSGTDTSIVKSFTTIPGAPSIDSLYATSISMTSATLNSEMNTGNQSTTIRFQWDTNNDAVWSHDSAASNSPLSTDGDATLGITGLLPNTTYYFRSYVSNPNDNDTSIVKSFTTVPGAPTIDSVYVTSVASDSAVLNSEMNTGNQSTTIRFQWDTNNDAIWANDQAASNSPRTTDGDALLTITGLSPNTTYYFRSYVTNATGNDTSAIRSFTTLPYAAVKAKVFLQGPYAGNDSMHTTLRQNGLIPALQPYAGSPWNYSGGENASTFPINVVDWVLVQLRSDTSTVTSTRAAFLKSDGSIVDTNGTSAVKFDGISGGDYYIVIENRNHLSVMSANKVTLPNATVYDFTTAQDTAYGSNPMADLGGGKFGMYGGDANGDGQITGSDFNIFNPKFINAATGYEVSDWNMDGQVTGSDFNIFNPNFVAARSSQVPD